MDIQTLKLELVSRIINTNKPSLLMEINKIFEKEIYADWWDELPKEVQESIMEGVKDIEKGNFHNHDQVMQEARQKYGF
jgi:hypothetical protein